MSALPKDLSPKEDENTTLYLPRVISRQQDSLHEMEMEIDLLFNVLKPLLGKDFPQELRGERAQESSDIAELIANSIDKIEWLTDWIRSLRLRLTVSHN